jgi:hypothetical protein
MVGHRIARIEQAFYVFKNERDQSQCDLQMHLDNGDTVQFTTGSNGETVRIIAAPWDDPFAEPLSAENRAFVEQSGKWTLFDTSTTSEMAPLIGQRIDRVFSVHDKWGTMHGVRLILGSLVLTYAVTGDEGFVIHGPAPDELARYGFTLNELAGGSS